MAVACSGCGTESDGCGTENDNDHFIYRVVVYNPYTSKMHIVPMFSSIVSVAGFSLDLVRIRRLLDSPETS